MAKAAARHILVDSEEKCLELKKQIEAGADFRGIGSGTLPVPQGRTAEHWVPLAKGRWSLNSTRWF